MNIFIQKKPPVPAFVFQKKLKNSHNMVPEILTEISAWMIKSDVRAETITNVQIVLAEALNNIVEHGFKYKKSGSVDIDINLSSPAIVARLTDNGAAFTPPEVVQSPLRDKDDLDNLPEGGFGWFLIRKITSSYEFRRVDDKNHLLLKFQ